jgi:hypothetical protein
MAAMGLTEWAAKWLGEFPPPRHGLDSLDDSKAQGVSVEEAARHPDGPADFDG